MPSTPSQPASSGQDEFSRRLAELSRQPEPDAAAPPNQRAAPSQPAAPGQPGPADEAMPESAAHTTAAPEPATVGAGNHVVQPGECISSIARDTGHFWQTIWDEPANAALKAARKLPNVLMPGDRVHVPDVRPKFEPAQTKMRHRFVRRGEPSHFAVRVMDQDIPRASEPYTLVIDGTQEITGFTDAEGKLDVPIPGNAKRGRLTVGVAPDTLVYDLDLGGLDPVSTWKGVQTRLKNLGLACELTGQRDQQTMDAVNEFRAANGLAASAELDEATRALLQRKHGS